MSIVRFCKRRSRERIMAGDMPLWISNNAARKYIAAVCVSSPAWVDRTDLEMLRAWAKARTVFTGELHVLDHIIPVIHPRVCGLTVPWNIQVIHWRANGVKSNTWEPDQLELFPSEKISA
jgi:hypothetical protein